VKFTDGAIEASVHLAERYISDRHLPDKAIDVMDEAGSRARLSLSVIPQELRDMESRIDELSKEKEAAIQNQEFEKAASYRDKEKDFRKQLAKVKREWNESRSVSTTNVDAEDIAVVVSKMTGIPISSLEESESTKLLRMEDALKKKLIGQDEAVQAVSRAVRRNRAGLRDPRRPIGSFIFLGPTGVGKTELARILAEFLFDDQEALIRIDMSEYMEKFSVSRLIGAPPGYVGYEEGGQLTEKVRRKPYSVVLLDEVEKAHPDVFNILLQVLEDGTLTDSMRRKVNFKNTVLIMTSNLGAQQIGGKANLGFAKDDATESHERMRSAVMDEVKRAFNPEFLNRIDEIIVFHALGRKEIEEIVRILLEDVRNRLKEHELDVSLTANAVALLVEKGFDPRMGARPLRRAIQRMIEDPLAEMVLAGKFPALSTVKVGRRGDELTFEIRESEGEKTGEKVEQGA
jgi:ATP-dependent Clp protease ATP-binding subunit ClpC